MKARKRTSRILAWTLTFLLCFGGTFSYALADGIEEMSEAGQEETVSPSEVPGDGLEDAAEGENGSGNTETPEDIETDGNPQDAEAPQDEEISDDVDVEAGFTYDPQPTTIEEARAAIEAYETQYQAALEVDGFLTALEVAKPRWQYEVPQELMPSGYHCELVDWDTDFGAVYYTFFPKPMAMATTPLPPGSTSTDLQDAVDNASVGDTIEILSDMLFTGTVTIPAGADITIKSDSSGPHILTQSSVNIRHFTVLGELTLEDIILDGSTAGNSATAAGGGIGVASGGTLMVEDGTRIQYCRTDTYGGGVYVGGGIFVMNGGEISGNLAQYGGGVDVRGDFTMNGGEISDNETFPSSGGGGGVHVIDGSFVMNDGLISNNKLNGSGMNYGGGVMVDSNSSFTMNDGEISGNASPMVGGGVAVYGTDNTGGNTFIMKGGAINDNAADYYGGGVFVWKSGASFVMTGGQISGNEASYGGGAHIDEGARFELNDDAVIHGNRATYGGGVSSYKSQSGSTYPVFIMDGGYINDNGLDESGSIVTINGGGIYLGTACDLTMNDGEVNGNTSAGSGGGIYAAEDTLITMLSGSVSNNNALPPVGNNSWYGGGICTLGTLILKDGLISENILECYTDLPSTNTANPFGLYGAGVYARDVEMYGGEISHNRLTGTGRATQTGGGVHFASTMLMEDGDISYNRVEAVKEGRYASGGGVSGGNFTMTGGAIHHNDVGTAPSASCGGGIVVDRGSWVKISGGEIYENNATWGGGIYINAFTGINDNSLITGRTKIYKNTACYGGGICFYNNVPSATMQPVISGNVKITENVADTAFGLSTDTTSTGGGVFYYAYLGASTYAGIPIIDAVIKENVEISGNICSQFGGGIVNRGYATASNTSVNGTLSVLTISDNVVVSNNEAATRVGVFAWNSSLLLKDQVQITTNSATGTVGGGGIGQQAGDYDEVRLTGSVRVIGNTAEYGNGGGIYTNDLTKLTVDANVVFADNAALTGSLWTVDTTITNPTDGADGTHNANILTTSFTAPFTNAYNNYDINYSYPGGTVYPVTYAANGGSGTAPTVSMIAENDTFPAAANTFTAPTGMQFKEWNTQSDGLGASYAAGATVTMPGQALTLYAIWENIPVTYAITYNANGGIGSYIGPNVASGGTDTVLTLAATGISRQNYVFLMWNTKADGTGIIYTPNDTIILYSDVTLYAQWRGITYPVTYDANGGIGTAPVESPKAAGATFAAATNTFTAPTGMQFKEWNTQNDGLGTSYAEGATVTMPGQALTLYAIWENIPVGTTYVVTYDGNGEDSGSVPVDSNNYSPGSSVAVLGNPGNLTKSGYTFIGWALNSAGTGVVYMSGDSYTINSDTTFYALWDDNSNPVTYYKLTVQAGAGGSVNTAVNGSYQAGDIVTITATPNTNYSFSGWTSSVSGVLANANSASTTLTMPEADVTVTAGFTYSGGSTTTYTVTYTANGGTGSKNVTDILGGTLHTVLSRNNTGISRSGYTFKGWNTQSDGKGTSYAAGDTITINGDITLYAQWTAADTVDIPQTGDNSNLLLWIIMVSLSMLAGVCLLVWIRVRKTHGVK